MNGISLITVAEQRYQDDPEFRTSVDLAIDLAWPQLSRLLTDLDTLGERRSMRFEDLQLMILFVIRRMLERSGRF